MADDNQVTGHPLLPSFTNRKQLREEEGWTKRGREDGAAGGRTAGRERERERERVIEAALPTSRRGDAGPPPLYQ